MLIVIENVFQKMAVNSDTLFTTLAVFGLISLVVYVVLTRTHRHPNRTGTAAGQLATPNAGLVRNSGFDSGNSTAVIQNSKSILREPCQRVPPHVSMESAKVAVNGGSNILVDGIVSFRHSKAAYDDAGLTKEQIAENRKDLARVLSRMISGADGSGTSLSAPPSKGSNVVVAFKLSDVGCEKLQRVLYLLATFYNLFVIVVVQSKEQFEGKEREDVISRLRGHDKFSTINSTTSSGEALSSNVLPSHRVVAATSVTGRVAFVRQLEKTELVLDFEEEVKDSLHRFGHNVFVYSKVDMSCVPTRTVASTLGVALL
jgi:hypothetical protein